MTNIRLIYASLACEVINFSTLKEILLQAETHNSKKNITGALCYGQGYFLQILEGPRKEVNELYLKIINDKRHSLVELIEVSTISARNFADWSMRYIRLDENKESSHFQLIKRLTDNFEFTPKDWSESQCRDLLIELSKL